MTHTESAASTPNEAPRAAQAEPAVGAIILARIPRVVWGMTDPERGGAVSLFQIFNTDALNHRTEHLTGVLEDECRDLMQAFFKKLRAR